MIGFLALGGVLLVQIAAALLVIAAFKNNPL
jgi:hypothetical protein